MSTLLTLRRAPGVPSDLPATEKHTERLAVFDGKGSREAFIAKHGHAPEHMTVDEMGGWERYFPAHMGKHLVSGDTHIHRHDDGSFKVVTYAADPKTAGGTCHSGHCK